MKSNKSYFTIPICYFIIGITPLISQVGINTSHPRTVLEVAGDMNISNDIEILDYNNLLDGDSSTFLVQEEDNSIKSLNVSNPTGVALAYIQEYLVVNPNLDWIKDFDTGIDATNYVVIVTSASFDLELKLTSTAGASDNSSIPYAAAFVKDGTWHLIADYPQAANIDHSQIGTWTISTLIFSNDVSKQFGTIDIPMGGNATGTATAPIID